MVTVCSIQGKTIRPQGLPRSIIESPCHLAVNEGSDIVTVARLPISSWLSFFGTIVFLSTKLKGIAETFSSGISKEPKAPECAAKSTFPGNNSGTMLEAVTAGIIIDGRYRIIDRIGDGGMGSVFRARDVDLDRTVAIKLLHWDLMEDEEHRSRFHLEGKILHQLSHPNIVVFYSFGMWLPQPDQPGCAIPYFVMELLEGISLRTLIDQGATADFQLVINMTMQVCEGVEAAHRAGIVHRDLKPDNIMVLPGELVKIVDFGLAKIRSSGQHLTQTGELIGSIYYMSPEQCRGLKADHRSDVYAIGCILYELLSGCRPFDAETPIGLMHKHATEAAKPLSLMAKPAFTSPQLAYIVNRAMAKSAEERYQSVRELADDLQLIQQGRSSEVPQFRDTGTSATRTITKTRVGLFVAPGLLILACGAHTLMKSAVPNTTKMVHHKDDRLHEIERGVDRAQKNLESAKRRGEDQIDEVGILKDRLDELRDEYFRRGESINAVELTDSLMKCLEFDTEGKTRKIDVWKDNHHAMLTFGKTEQDPAKRQLLHKWEDRSLDVLTKIAVSTSSPYALVTLAHERCISLSAQGRFSDARKSLEASWPIFQKFNPQPVSVLKPIETEDLKALRARETLAYLLPATCSSKEDALDLCTMLIALAQCQHQRNGSKIAQSARTRAREILDQFYPSPPKTLFERTQYNELIKNF